MIRLRWYSPALRRKLIPLAPKQALIRGRSYGELMQRAYDLLDQSDQDGYSEGYHLLYRVVTHLIETAPEQALDALREVFPD